MAQEIKANNPENTNNKEEVKMKVKNGLKKAGKVALLVGVGILGYLCGTKKSKTDSDTYGDECEGEKTKTSSDDVTE
jgi:hypothetical protein